MLIADYKPDMGLPSAGSPVEGDAPILRASRPGSSPALLDRRRHVDDRLAGTNRLRVAEFDADPVRPRKGKGGATGRRSRHLRPSSVALLRREELVGDNGVVGDRNGESEDLAAAAALPVSVVFVGGFDDDGGGAGIVVGGGSDADPLSPVDVSVGRDFFRAGTIWGGSCLVGRVVEIPHDIDSTKKLI